MMIIKALIEDAATILELQKLAFRSEAVIYDDFCISPLVESLEEIKIEFAAKTALKAIVDDRLVGSVRALERGGTCYIDRLIVHPDFQDKGIGTKLMDEIEGVFPGATRFELFTGDKSEKNIRLYKKLGYQVFKHRRVDDVLSFTYMEKLK
jgi:ribosomal protein S18 acetylase RimI-like enzyme